MRTKRVRASTRSRTGRSPATLLLPLGLGLLALVVFWGRSDEEARGVASREALERSKRGVGVEIAAPSASPTGSRATPQVAPGCERSGASLDGPSRGTVVVLDWDPDRPAQREGVLRLRPVDDSVAEALACSVSSGEWAAELPAGSVWEVEAIQLEGVRLEPVTREIRASEDELEVLARCLPDVVLHVLDAADRAPLEHVTVVGNLGWMRELDAHPGLDIPEHAFLVRDRPSPIPLERLDRERVYWVGAPGRAWTRVALGEGSSGESVVLLEPGCELELVLHRGTVREPLALALHTSGSSGSASSPVLFARVAGRDSLRVEGLHAGDSVVEVGPSDRMGRELSESLATAAIRLAPGECGVLELWPEPAPVEAPGALSFTVLPPPGVSLGALDVRAVVVHPIEVEARSRRRAAVLSLPELSEAPDGGSLEGHYGSLPPGRYRLSIDPLQYGIDVHVPSAGHAHAQLLLPALAHVLVDVVDVHGEGVTPERIDWIWRPTQSDEPECCAYPRPPVDLGRGPEFVTAPGQVVLMVHHQGHRWTREFELEAGANLLRMELRPIHSLDLVVEHQGVRIPMPGMWWEQVQVVSLSGLGGLSSLRLGIERLSAVATEATLELDGPGRYAVELPAVAPGGPPLAAEVEVMDPVHRLAIDPWPDVPGPLAWSAAGACTADPQPVRGG